MNKYNFIFKILPRIKLTKNSNASIHTEQERDIISNNTKNADIQTWVPIGVFKEVKVQRRRSDVGGKKRKTGEIRILG
ncbi:MAG: hypothetical protein LBT77_00510 [Mycoplasmataceae bacterium]|nr:hypothetical protein [Mycoplasmataceae bacterium]